MFDLRVLLIVALSLCLSPWLSDASPSPRASDEAEDDFFAYLNSDVDEARTRAILSPARRAAAGVIMAAESKLGQQQIRDILELHGQARQATGGNNQMAMTWDEDLARLAQGLSDTCEWGHANMVLPDGTRTGQNLAAGWDTSKTQDQLVRQGVQGWIDEKRDYDVASGVCAAGKKCGHYTQVVWSESTKVGCGVTDCPGLGTYLVCDYTTAGNVYGEKAVNLGGAPCSECNLYPGTACDDGLCSVCDPEKRSDCRPYDASTCVDAKKDPGVGDCGWVTPFCSQAIYRSWLEESCAKTCGYCHS